MTSLTSSAKGSMQIVCVCADWFSGITDTICWGFPEETRKTVNPIQSRCFGKIDCLVPSDIVLSRFCPCCCFFFWRGGSWCFFQTVNLDYVTINMDCVNEEWKLMRVFRMWTFPSTKPWPKFLPQTLLAAADSIRCRYVTEWGSSRMRLFYLHWYMYMKIPIVSFDYLHVWSENVVVLHMLFFRISPFTFYSRIVSLDCWGDHWWVIQVSG